MAWVLDLPTKVLAESDPVLKQQIDHDSAEGAYEALCLLYVALTRAKQALYVVVEPLKKSKSKNFPQLLNASLGPDWSCGDPAWYRKVTRRRWRLHRHQLLRSRRILAGGSDLSREHRRGNRLSALRVRSGLIVSPQDDNAGRGSGIHEELARIEWSDDLTLIPWLEKRRSAGVDEAILQSLRTCLEHDSLKTVFCRPAEAPAAEVWRERSFEIVWEDEWISGAFDRVVVLKDVSGQATEARLYDFKTGGGSDPGGMENVAQQYNEQLSLYRKVVGRLTGLAEESISAEVVFTTSGVRVLIP